MLASMVDVRATLDQLPPDTDPKHHSWELVANGRSRAERLRFPFAIWRKRSFAGAGSRGGRPIALRCEDERPTNAGRATSAHCMSACWQGRRDRAWQVPDNRGWIKQYAPRWLARDSCPIRRLGAGAPRRR